MGSVGDLGVVQENENMPAERAALVAEIVAQARKAPVQRADQCRHRRGLDLDFSCLQTWKEPTQVAGHLHESHWNPLSVGRNWETKRHCGKSYRRDIPRKRADALPFAKGRASRIGRYTERSD